MSRDPSASDRGGAAHVATPRDARLPWPATAALAQATVQHQAGRIVDADRAFRVLFRAAQEEVVGRRVLDFVADESRSEARRMLAAADGEPAEVVAVRRDGTRFLAESASLRMAAVDVVTFRDTAMRDLHENLLPVLVRAVEVATDGIVICGPHSADNPILYANPRFCETTQYSLDELLGRNCRFLQGPETDPESTRVVREAIQAHREVSATLVNYRKDGSAYWNEIYLTPIPGAGGPADYWLGTMHEVTQRVEAERDVERLNEALERRVHERTAELRSAYRELEGFSDSVSHDLRAPLRGMDVYLSALEEEFGERLGAEGTALVRQARGESRYVSALVQDLLRLSRSSRGEIRRARVDLSELARSIGEALRRDDPHQPSVAFRVEDGLEAMADPRLVRVVLENLLGNAWKFTRGKPERRVTFGARMLQGRPAYFVRDNGIGFRMQDAGQLFLPFRRLQAARAFEGTGIGLATVQRIVQRHGGQLWAEGEPGEGATIWFTLG